VTQAAYISANQVNARARMRSGDSAIAVLRWLQANDAIGSPFNNKSHRQYGAVKLGEGSAAYTGSNCMTYANHITGPNYCIQGNILLGKAVLDSMEARFLRAEGDLACRLMAAMQGAKMVGADTRCAQNNSSSLFAFLKVTLPADTFGKPSLLVSLKTHQGDSIEPIDSLQVLFDAVRTCTVNTTGLHRSLKENGPWMFPNPAAHEVVILPAYDEPGTCRITDLCGQTVFFSQVKGRISVNVRQWPRGVYQVEFRSDSGTRVKRLVLD
jgi:hypothetical protein